MREQSGADFRPRTYPAPPQQGYFGERGEGGEYGERGEHGERGHYGGHRKRSIFDIFD